MKELITALVECQKEFEQPKRTKKAYNYMYAPLEEVIKSVTPILCKHGLVIIQLPINEGMMVGVKTILGHSSGETIEGDFLATPTKSDPQSLGSIISYYRRYGLLAILGLAQEDDDGASVSNSNQGNSQNNAQGSADLDNHVLPFGKYKGMKLKDVPKKDLEGWNNYLKDNRKDGDNKSKAFTDMIDSFLSK
jgi:hypothetical protein